MDPFCAAKSKYFSVEGFLGQIPTCPKLFDKVVDVPLNLLLVCTVHKENVLQRFVDCKVTVLRDG